jgi:hypothetical protein
MSLNKDVDTIKESFWKEPINESAKVAFQNEKVTVYGPMESQEDIDGLLKGKFYSDIVSRDDGQTWFLQHHNAGESFYIVMAKSGEIWIVQVQQQKKTWWDKTQTPVKPDEVVRISTSLGIPQGDSNESVIEGDKWCTPSDEEIAKNPKKDPKDKRKGPLLLRDEEEPIDESPLFNPRRQCTKCGEWTHLIGFTGEDQTKCAKCGGPSGWDKEEAGRFKGTTPRPAKPKEGR